MKPAVLILSALCAISCSSSKSDSDGAPAGGSADASSKEAKDAGDESSDGSTPGADANIPDSEFASECAMACAEDEDADDCTMGELDECTALCKEATAGLGESCGACMVSETGVFFFQCEPDIPAVFECPDACDGDGDGPASFVLRCKDACENNDWASSCSAGQVNACAAACETATAGKSQRCGSCITNFSSLVEGCVADIADEDLCAGSCE